jgi:hypothetical protein
MPSPQRPRRLPRRQPSAATQQGSRSKRHLAVPQEARSSGRPLEAWRNGSLLPPDATDAESTRKHVADFAFGLVVSGGAVWVFLAYFGIV